MNAKHLDSATYSPTSMSAVTVVSSSSHNNNSSSQARPPLFKDSHKITLLEARLNRGATLSNAANQNQVWISATTSPDLSRDATDMQPQPIVTTAAMSTNTGVAAVGEQTYFTAVVATDNSQQSQQSEVSLPSEHTDPITTPDKLIYRLEQQQPPVATIVQHPPQPTSQRKRRRNKDTSGTPEGKQHRSMSSDSSGGSAASRKLDVLQQQVAATQFIPIAASPSGPYHPPPSSPHHMPTFTINGTTTATTISMSPVHMFQTHPSPFITMTSPSANSNSQLSQHSASNSNSACDFITRTLHTQTELQACQIDAQINSLRGELDEKTRQAESLQREKEALIAANDSMQNKTKIHEESFKKSVDVIKSLLIEKFELERKTVRRQANENSYRIGQSSWRRQTTGHLSEEWSAGVAYQEIDKRKSTLTQLKEELEEMKRTIARRKKQPEQLSAQEFFELDEVIKLRTQGIKKEENDVQIEVEKLERERVLQNRRLKRIADEDSSQYRHFIELDRRYLLLSLLGKGGFSEVWKAFDMKTMNFVAIKIHQLCKDWKEEKKHNYIRHAVRELEIHKTLKHARIVPLIEIFDINSECFCTVMEYSDGNDLDIYLKQNKMLPEREARSIVTQIMSAMKYLNELTAPIIHYDLKPGNILLGTGVHSGEIKITDFGLSKIMEKQHVDDGGMELTSMGAGTYWYLPPECFYRHGLPTPRISSKVDVWSIGVIFYQMLYGKKPFGDGMTQREVNDEQVILNAREVQFPQKPQVSNEAKLFMKRCLLYSQEDRPDILRLADDEYLKPTPRQQRSSTTEPSSPAAAAASQHAAAIVSAAMPPPAPIQQQ